MKTVFCSLILCSCTFGFVYDFRALDFFDKPVDFQNLKMYTIVIFASTDDCKLTSELSALNNIYQTHKDKLVTFVGFAIYSAKNQDKKFCSINYGVDFSMLDKFNNGIGKLQIYTKQLYKTTTPPLYQPLIVHQGKIIVIQNAQELNATLSTLAHKEL